MNRLHPPPRRLAILGATGSIGRNTLAVVAQHPDQLNVVALTAHRDVIGMTELCRQYKPQIAVMAEPTAALALSKALSDQPETQVLAGPDGVDTAAALERVDTVVAAIVGVAGMSSCLAAVQAGKRVLIANKEALVVAGELIMAQAAEHQAHVLPIDSEHNALFQCLPAASASGWAEQGVRQLVLTASGGPFREWAVQDLADVTVEQACAHPNWAMGQKISVDSATMMNKGLEVIEACRFFAIPSAQVDVWVHPQSLVHALVQYADGSTLAQLGYPDMRTPIAHALAWPMRMDAGVQALNLAQCQALTFAPPDTERFPCLGLARSAMAQGSAATAALNGANEVAVAAFLEQRLRFDRIAAVIEATLERVESVPSHDLEALLATEQTARTQAIAHIKRWSH